MTIIYGIMQWILSVAEIVLCYYFCDVLLDKGMVKRNWIYVGSWSIVIGTLLDINRNLVFMSYNMILFQCVLIFISLIKKLSKVYSLGVVMIYNVFVALLQLFNAFFLLITVKVIHVDDIYYKINSYRIVVYLLALFIIYSLVTGVKRYNKYAELSLKPSKGIVLISGILGLIVVLVFQTQMLTYGKEGSLKNTFLLSVLIVIMLAVFLIYIWYSVTKAEYKVLELKSSMMEEHYQEMYQMYQTCACSIHDFKHHLLLLEDYCKADECQKAITYIDKIRKPLANVEYHIKSGNEIVDLILNFKFSEAKEKKITIETDIQNMQGLSIEENDICSIFSNLIDNAVEACNAIKEGEKWIKVFVRNLGDMLVIKIENSYGNILHKVQDDYQTDKKGVHGYGIKSVRLIVEKYRGDVKWSHTEKAFITVVTFFNVNNTQSEMEENENEQMAGRSKSGRRFMQRDARDTEG